MENFSLWSTITLIVLTRIQFPVCPFSYKYVYQTPPYVTAYERHQLALAAQAVNHRALGAMGDISGLSCNITELPNTVRLVGRWDNMTGRKHDSVFRLKIPTRM